MIDQNLVQTINDKLKSAPLVYISIEVERALGIESLLSNYHILCYDDSPIIDELIKAGVQVHCYQRSVMAGFKPASTLRRTTAAMLGSQWARDIIASITSGNHFYLQTFHPSKPFEFQAQKYNCTLLNNSAQLCELFENKITAAEIFARERIAIPPYVITEITEINWDRHTAQLKTAKLVIQTEKSHTGEGTFIVDNADELNKLQSKFAGGQVKLSAFINGPTWTINGCVTDSAILIHGLSYQITGISELTTHVGATVGNDWTYARTLSAAAVTNVKNLTDQVGKLLRAKNYRGLFGIDIILDLERAYLIEVNARQTANIPLQSYLETKQQQTPLAIVNVAQWLNLPVSNANYELQDLDGAQLFDRAKANLQVKSAIKIGTYRLQSDNSAIDWNALERKEDVIFLDEAQDKPLIFQQPSYNITQINESGFQLLISSKGSYSENQELARIQTTHGLISNGQVKPWAIEALIAIERQLI